MSGPIHFDDVKMTCTGTNGTITVVAAVSPYAAIPAAADAKLIHVRVAEVDGNGNPNGAWEVFTGLYTHSALTVTRGTFRASSTGSLVTFGGGTKHITIVPPAAMFNATATGTDAAITLANRTELELDASILTADRILTLPVASAGVAIGDEIWAYLSKGNDAYEAILKTGAGETCSDPLGTDTDIAAASEITRIFISGEGCGFKKISATKWRFIDKRKPMKGLLRLNTSAATETAAAATYPTGKSGVWVADTNIGNCAVIASDKMLARRKCKATFSVTCWGGSQASVTADKYYRIGCDLNVGAAIQLFLEMIPSVAAAPKMSGVLANFPMVVDDYMRFFYSSEEGSRGLYGEARAFTTFGMTEQL